MLEIVVAMPEGVDLGRVDVEADHVESGPMECRQKGQTDVAQPDDADGGGFGVDLVEDVHWRQPFESLWVERQCIAKKPRMYIRGYVPAISA